MFPQTTEQSAWNLSLFSSRLNINKISDIFTSTEGGKEIQATGWRKMMKNKQEEKQAILVLHISANCVENIDAHKKS